MYPAQLHLFATPEALARAFAAELAREIATGRPLHLALSGGSTPQRLFQLLAAAEEPLDWTAVHLYWGDERCVAPDHGESNYGVTRKLLLDRIDIPAANVHRIRGEAPPAEAAQNYGDLLRQALPTNDGVPVFDWILLGMGSDGHTASIFPHQMELLRAEGPCALAVHPDSGQRRVSLTGPVLNAARRVSFLITGASKRAVFTKILHRQNEWETYPTAHIQPSGQLEFYLDQFVLHEGEEK
ncbi:MAG: 6-phosphogluconolactonase [Bacteroidota bacterium]